MKRKQVFMVFIGLIFIMMMAGCAGVQVTMQEKTAVFHILGYQTAFWPLNNNRDYIPKIEKSVDYALVLLSKDTGTLDIQKMVGDIVVYINDLRAEPAFATYAPVFLNALRQLESLVAIKVTIPAQRQDAIDYTTAFLTGAKEAITDLKALTP